MGFHSVFRNHVAKESQRLSKQMTFVRPQLASCQAQSIERHLKPLQMFQERMIKDDNIIEVH